MTAYALKILKVAVGSVLILLGFLGALLPIIPGMPLLLVGFGSFRGPICSIKAVGPEDRKSI